ncbi:MAG: MFS transporter [Buchnera aphidicola (Periphyllus lyropictus)]|uniref:MFS transporter n=1 Tax=Buchnera aphidicola TaxID=9 RepID=UPI001EB0C777|nr:MFS transporter [Buchnera aphidicola]NIH16842.1 MFS transporter [Buchnera aphidicola (Periphyllus lyropictus)]USS94713.1 MFS transporter [Buchnera aphidicola (Periphyllus lyropictus)]
MLKNNNRVFIHKKINNKYIKKNTTDFYKTIFSLFLAGFSAFSILYSIQPILPIFSKIFYLTPFQSSLALSVSTISMALGTLFIASISNCIGRKQVMFVSLFLASLLTIICSFSKNWFEIVFLRSLIGFSLSGITSIAIIYLSEEVEISILPLCIGLYISGNTIGGFFGRLVSNIIIKYFSWNLVFILIGFFSLFISFLFFLNLPSSKNFTISVLNFKILLKNLYKSFQTKLCIFLFLIGFFLMGSFVTLFNYIGYRLIIKPFSLNSVFISFLSLIYLIGVYFSPKASFLSKKYGKINLLIGSFFLMILGIFLTYYNFLFLIIFGLFCFTSGFFLVHSTTSSWISFLSKKYQVEISSLYFFFYYLGSSLFGSIGGFFWFYWGWSGVFCVINFMLTSCLIFILLIKYDY